MSKLGNNTKWTILPQHRDAMVRMLERGLDAKLFARPSPTMTVFELPGGAKVGVAIDECALTPEQAKKGAWLELLVADPERVASVLDGLGVERVSYVDTGHVYYQSPGGPVFRLASG